MYSTRSTNISPSTIVWCHVTRFRQIAAAETTLLIHHIVETKPRLRCNNMESNSASTHARVFTKRVRCTVLLLLIFGGFE